MSENDQKSNFATAGAALSCLGETGDAPALFAFGAEDVEQWSFGELDELVGRLASGLRGDGLSREESVALLAPPSAAYIAVALGILRAEGVVVPIDAQMADKPLRHALRDCGATRLFTDERGARRIGKLDLDDKPRILRLDQEKGEDSWRGILGKEAAGVEEASPDARAVIFYTSGTTGPPKGVPLSRGNVAYQFEVLLENRLIQKGDRLVLPLPLHHVYPFVCGTLAPLHLGLPLVLPAALTGPQLARAVRESEASVIVGVPRLHRALVDGIKQKALHGGIATRLLFRAALAVSLTARKTLGLRLGRYLFGSLHRRLGGRVRLMASGGSPLDPNLARQLEAFGWQVAIGYGLTETSPLLTILRPGDSRFETVGRPVNGTELKIDPSAAPGGEDRSDQDSDGPQPGEILARGPGVFSGYHNLPEETEEAISDKWFRTGDLGRLDDDGYLRVEGRISTMLVLEGGENLAPETLEEIYAECDEIDEAGIFQREGKLVALLVPNEKIPADQARKRVEEALERLREDLPSYQRLSDFKLTSKALPRTRLGKIRRHELVEWYESEGKDKGDTPRTGAIQIDEMSTEDQSLLDNERARKLWQFLAERYSDHRLEPESRLDTNLGIDSMEWVELTGTIEERLGISLGEDIMEKAKTVHDLLEAAADSGAASEAESRRALKDPESVLSEKDRRWIKPRTRFHAILGRPLYLVHEIFMRMLFRIELHGRENLPDTGPYVLTPNHTSYLDGPALIAALDFRTIRTFFWAGLTAALFKNRFWGALSRLGQVVPIDPQRGPLSSLAFGAAVLQRGRPLVWFPEGRRSPNGELETFRPGLGLILEHHKAPVLPVHIEGTYASLPPGRRLPRPGRIVVRIGQPLDPDQLAEEGKGDTRHERIVNALHNAVARLQKETLHDREKK